MPVTMDRREWLTRSGAAAVYAVVAGCQSAPSLLKRGDRDLVRLNLNENPYGPSPAARKAMAEAFDESHLYRGIPYQELRKLIAEQEDIPPDHIVIGSGSGEILNVAGLIYGRDGGEILAPQPTFEQLQQYATTVGATIHRVPLDDRMNQDLKEMSRRISSKTSLVYICNPNNPTGVLVDGSALRTFCEDASGRTVVYVDEAYHEFVDSPTHRTMVELVREGRNVIVSRTASKIHALAGLRIGFGIARPDIIRTLAQHRTGSVNVVGLRGAIASYHDAAYQSISKRRTQQGKEALYALLDRTGHRYLRSEGNFVFFQTGRSIEQFRTSMQEQGILVARPFPPFNDWCRVSIGTDEGMERFAQALQTVFNS
jgi:histidinol-phosphate aminotransferase